MTETQTSVDPFSSVWGAKPLAVESKPKPIIAPPFKRPSELPASPSSSDTTKPTSDASPPPDKSRANWKRARLFSRIYISIFVVCIIAWTAIKLLDEYQEGTTTTMHLNF